MTFKESISKDLSTFFNINEFAEEHIINGRELNIIIDNERLQERSKKEFDGIYIGQTLYFVKSVDYGIPPRVDEQQWFDNQLMEVFDVRTYDGMYEIILRRNG